MELHLSKTIHHIQGTKGKEIAQPTEAQQTESGYANHYPGQKSAIPTNLKSILGINMMLAFFTFDCTQILLNVLQKKDAKITLLVQNINGKLEVIVTINARSENRHHVMKPLRTYKRRTTRIPIKLPEHMM